ncbi:MAG: type II toxin-antitoxin system RelE/ParE family toxin [Vulcanimicrobiaceae bacterium]
MGYISGRMRFADDGTRDIANGADTAKARRAVPPDLLTRARIKVYAVLQASELLDLKSPPGNQLERLSGDRAGQHSIRINDQYRVCFRWAKNLATEIEVVDYH